MISGDIVLTNFELGIAELERETTDGSKARMIALIAKLKEGDEHAASIIIPMTPEGIVGVTVGLAGLLTPQEKAMLMGRLTLKSVTVAQPGDVSKVADKLGRGVSGQKP